MALRFTKSGLQSFDPKEEFRKKFRNIAKKPPFKRVDPKVAIQRAKEAEAKRGKRIPETFTQRGRLGGATVEGKTFLGLKPAETEKLIAQKGGVSRSVSEARSIEQAEEEVAKIQEEEDPTRRELSPEDVKALGTGLPVIGASLSVIDLIVADVLKNTEVGRLILGHDIEQLPTPEELRSISRTEIERQVFEEGLTSNEKFGAMVESIGLAGLAKGLLKLDLETPGGNVRTVAQNIRREMRRATKYEMWAKQGELDPDVAYRRIEEIEENIQRLESRIKLLINYSPELRYNSDGVNVIETEILKARELTLAAKTNAIRGAITDPQMLNSFIALKDVEVQEYAEELVI